MTNISEFGIYPDSAYNARHDHLYNKQYQEMLKRLKKARKQAGLTQVQVATALKRPQSFVSKCESGERRIDAIELATYAKLYKKKVVWFIPEGE